MIPESRAVEGLQKLNWIENFPNLKIRFPKQYWLIILG